MENKKIPFNCDQAREIDLVDYLARLGFRPARIRNHNYWYHSPFRDERTPSFKVDRKLNLWYDFGEATGGSVIDFAIRYHDCSIGEWLAIIRSEQPFEITETPKRMKAPEPPAIAVQDVRSLRHEALLLYLRDRRIPIEIADKYCKEVHYTVEGRHYFAIGFPNDEGGWELRSRNFKGCASPKMFTSIRNPSSEVCVFEGFFNFLSYKAIIPYHRHADSSFMILNSAAYFERARSFIEQHQVRKLFFDHDHTGRHVTRYALSLGSGYVDESGLYLNHNDLNEMHCHFGRNRRAGLSP